MITPLHTPPPTHAHTPNLDLKEMKLPLIKDTGSPVLIENVLFTIAKVFKQARLTIDGYIHIYVHAHIYDTHTCNTHIFIPKRYEMNHNSALK